MKVIKTYGRRYKENCGDALQRQWSPEVLEVPTKRKADALFDDLLSEYQNHCSSQKQKVIHDATGDPQDELDHCLFSRETAPLQDTSNRRNQEGNSSQLKSKYAHCKGKYDSNNKRYSNAKLQAASTFKSPAKDTSITVCRSKRNEDRNQTVQWSPQFISTPIGTLRRVALQDHSPQNGSISGVQWCKSSIKMREVENDLLPNSCYPEQKDTITVMSSPTLRDSKWITMRRRNKNSGCPFTLRTLLGMSSSISVTKNDDVLVGDSLEESVDTLTSSQSALTEKTWLTLGRIPGRRAEKVLVSDAASATTAVLDFHLVAPPEEETKDTLCNTTLLDVRETLLHLCNQSVEVTFLQALNVRGSSCSKLGEGLYGEVFCWRGGVFKVVPVEGRTLVNGEKQKLMLEILPEVLISRELSSLASTSNSSANFIHMRRVHLVQGKYHPALLKAWDVFHKTHKSENDRPDFFEGSQKYVMFEFENGGTCLENWKINRAQEAQSIFLQVACTLAMGEGALEFEHRDLHLGNILVSKTCQKKKSYQFDGKTVIVSTAGLAVAVIDYTLSRMKKGGSIIFTDLSNDTTLFMGKGDYQFEVYRLMKRSNKNNWEDYNPYSNVLWLHYLVHKLLQRCTKPSDVRQQLLSWSKLLLTCSSATDFVIKYC